MTVVERRGLRTGIVWCGLVFNPQVNNGLKLSIFPLLCRYDRGQRAASGRESREGMAGKMERRFSGDDIGGLNWGCQASIREWSTEHLMKRSKMKTNQISREREPNMIRDSAASLCNEGKLALNDADNKRIDGTRKRDTVDGRPPGINVSRLGCSATRPEAGTAKTPL